MNPKLDDSRIQVHTTYADSTLNQFKLLKHTESDLLIERLDFGLTFVLACCSVAEV